MNIAEILVARANSQPDMPAIIEGRGRRARRTTFAELDRATAAGRWPLVAGRTCAAGDHVPILQGMSTELYVALGAIFRLGLVGMFVDPSAGREHVEHCCSLEPPRALIAGTKGHLLRLWSPALRRFPRNSSSASPSPARSLGARCRVRSSAEKSLPARPSRRPCLPSPAAAPGIRKLPCRTHGFLRARHRILAQSLQLKIGDVDLTTMPIVLLANLASGVTSVIPDVDLRNPGDIDPATVVAQIREHQVVSSAASPAFFERLARHCAQLPDSFQLPQRCSRGGACLSASDGANAGHRTAGRSFGYLWFYRGRTHRSDRARSDRFRRSQGNAHRPRPARRTSRCGDPRRNPCRPVAKRHRPVSAPRNSQPNASPRISLARSWSAASTFSPVTCTARRPGGQIPGRQRRLAPDG